MKEKIHYIGWWESGANKAYIQEVTSDKGSDFKGIVIKFGYLSQYTGLRGSKEKGWFRIDNQRILYPKYGVNWEEGDIVLDVKKEIKESTMDIKKIIREEIQKLKEEPGRFKPLPEPKRHSMANRKIDSTPSQPSRNTNYRSGRPDSTKASLSQTDVMSEKQFSKVVRDMASDTDVSEPGTARDLAENLYASSAIKYYLNSKGLKNRNQAIEFLKDRIAEYA